MADDPSLKALEEASKGLLYPSESDEPFDVFSWPAEGGKSVADVIAARAGAGKKIEEVDAGGFFSELAETDDAARFDKLRSTLESQLAGLKILRVGAIRIDVYLIGQTRSGNWAGTHTISVET